MALAQDYLAMVALIRGNPDRAYALFRESLALALQLGHPELIAEGLVGMAVIVAGQDAARAARYCGAADALFERAGVAIWPTRRRHYDAALDTVRAALGTEAFDAAWAEGRAMTREQAVAYALAGEPVSV